MFRLAFTVALLLASCSGFESRLPSLRLSSNRIVGGSIVDITTRPFQASLHYAGFHVCGAAILGDRWAITSAYCIDYGATTSFSIRTGSSIFYEGGVETPVSAVTKHPSYDPITLDYDFAILELSAPLSFDATTQGISSAGSDPADGTTSTVSGWGETLEGNDDGFLRAVDVPIVSRALCNSQYAEYGGITDSMICAGYAEGGRDACTGDSGGPLTADGVLVGIVSWGNGCALPGYPGVYARISHVASWISSVTGL